MYHVGVTYVGVVQWLVRNIANVDMTVQFRSLTYEYACVAQLARALRFHRSLLRVQVPSHAL